MEIKTFNVEDLDYIVKNSDAFYKKSEIIEIDNKKYKFSIYNYNIANIADFKKFAPCSFELRGLTINNEDGNMFLSVHKFFNQNENDLVINELKGDLEVRIKLDGSLIQPIIVKDKVIYKTKGTFNSYQANFVNNKIKNKHLIDKFVLDLYYEYNYLPLFEFISPYNQIVVKYTNTLRTLIQIRDLSTGKYLEYDEMKKIASKYAIPTVEIVDTDFKTLLKWQEDKIDTEGWVIWDKQQKYTSFRKIKTRWYLTIHNLSSPNNLQENKIILHILDETIDDIISVLSTHNPKRKYIEDIVQKITKYIHYNLNFIEKIYFTDRDLYLLDNKKFVDKYKSNNMFPIIMKVINKENFNKDEVISLIKEYIKRNTSKLNKARKFLSSI